MAYSASMANTPSDKSLKQKGVTVGAPWPPDMCGTRQNPPASPPGCVFGASVGGVAAESYLFIVFLKTPLLS